MADTDEVKEPEDSKENLDDEKSSKSGILLWIILAVVVALCAGVGFGLGRLFAGSDKGKPAADSQQATVESNQAENVNPDITDSTAKSSQKTWYYDLEPVVANLDEPNVTRYVRVALTLQMNPDVSQKKGNSFLEEKKLLLANWLTIYLAGLSIEEIRGDKNLERIQ